MQLTVKKIVQIFIAICIITLFGKAFYNTHQIKKDIEKHKYVTIGKVYKFSSNRSFSHYYYIYYYKGKKFSNSDDIDGFDREECIGKYYNVTISTVNPNNSELYLYEQILDSTKINEIENEFRKEKADKDRNNYFN